MPKNNDLDTEKNDSLLMHFWSLYTKSLNNQTLRHSIYTSLCFLYSYLVTTSFFLGTFLIVIFAFCLHAIILLVYSQAYTSHPITCVFFYWYVIPWHHKKNEIKSAHFSKSDIHVKTQKYHKQQTSLKAKIVKKRQKKKKKEFFTSMLFYLINLLKYIDGGGNFRNYNCWVQRKSYCYYCCCLSRNHQG